MENGTNPEGKRVIKSKPVVITAVVLSLFAVYFLLMSVLSPAAAIRSLNEKHGYIEPEKGGLNDTLLIDSAFIALNRQKAFLQARISMAAYDSVSLTIDLADSALNLEIRGVTVFSSKPQRIRISKVFTLIDNYALTSLLSRPFVIKNDYSTIPKEPVVHVVAPRDTSEYKPYEVPDTSRREFVYVVLETENGFRLYICQDPSGNLKAQLRRFVFDFADRVRNAAYITRCMVTFRKPEYKPFIRVTLPARDARIIYRALPANGQFAVHL